MEIVRYDPRHLDAVVALCKAEGWTTFAGNHQRAGRAMTGPGVTALVAVERGPGDPGEGDAGRAEGAGRAGTLGDEDGAGGTEDRGPRRVLGFSQAVGDGAFGGYLCMLLVAEDARRQGIGKALIERTLVESGVLRLDLLSSDRAMPLYERFPHVRVPGFRLYPDESLRPRSS